MTRTIDKSLKHIDNKINQMRTKNKDSDHFKVKDNVFDEATLNALHKLFRKRYIEALGGPISTGKEANVFLAEGEDKELAIKIYRISSSTFRAMEDYILGDPRFSNIRNAKKDIIFAWTKKEYRNLIRAKEAGIRVPEPMITERNILVMEFMGDDGKAYPLLKYVSFDIEDGQRIYHTVTKYMRMLYQKAKLVHGDLSEYNIMIDTHDLSPIIIDVGQAVTLEHPRADYFLRRDVENIIRYFKRYKINTSPEELYTYIINSSE
ncbi:MAG: serine protein kinase RIO [Methanosarcinaceae archaeon]|nr:serine protein kinase RIO [Methanosarcinaceae archaeon]